MFYPFNAKMAQNKTDVARVSTREEEKILLDAYLQIAHVYINRAASRGYNTIAVYCPSFLRKEFLFSLENSGFEIMNNIPNSSYHRIKW